MRREIGYSSPPAQPAHESPTHAHHPPAQPAHVSPIHAHHPPAQPAHESPTHAHHSHQSRMSTREAFKEEQQDCKQRNLAKPLLGMERHMYACRLRADIQASQY